MDVLCLTQERCGEQKLRKHHRDPQLHGQDFRHSQVVAHQLLPKSEEHQAQSHRDTAEHLQVAANRRKDAVPKQQANDLHDEEDPSNAIVQNKFSEGFCADIGRQEAVGN